MTAGTPSAEDETAEIQMQSDTFVLDFVEEYEFRFGGGGYSPTDTERVMLEDFGEGLLAAYEEEAKPAMKVTAAMADAAELALISRQWLPADTSRARADVKAAIKAALAVSAQQTERRP